MHCCLLETAFAFSSSLLALPKWLPSSAWSLEEQTGGPKVKGEGWDAIRKVAPLYIYKMGSAHGRWDKRQMPPGQPSGLRFCGRRDATGLFPGQRPGLQNLAGRDVHGWEDTVATCAGGSPREHAAQIDGWWLNCLWGRSGAGEGGWRGEGFLVKKG